MDRVQMQLDRILEESQILLQEPMKKHTTFRVGGPASYFVMPKSVQEVAQIIALCRQENMPYYILGNGSNLLVSDKGYEGVIIAIGKGMDEIRIEGEIVTVGAGALMSAIARRALEASLTGFEFAAGIPGSIGGAVRMNAGAYGGEMKQILVSATVLTGDGQVKEIPVEELALGYRTSCVKQKGLVVVEAKLKLEAGSADAIRARMEELASMRREKQPLEYPSAGSTFKRPEGYFAGKLIQDAGLKGFSVGGAQVSEKHSGFVINRDQATAADVKNLCIEVSRRVEEQFGVLLELEVETLGEF